MDMKNSERKTSKQLIAMELLKRVHPMDSIQIRKATGLLASTVTPTAREMVEAGIIQEVKARQGSGCQYAYIKNENTQHFLDHPENFHKRRGRGLSRPLPPYDSPPTLDKGSVGAIRVKVEKVPAKLRVGDIELEEAAALDVYMALDEYFKERGLV